ncbi:hypothetical protein C8A03DRAFT_29569 [Achaetomium macrosporum]|uniref:BZIP domain-containing protein n=1 Tax=Achaetomium macrosporum TaxID=79813 RepID=A0AAN7CIL2_9PEZI|nr:hypothetical protein C8A03DRAFT_29569 [Achaetomium macrosporum]
MGPSAEHPEEACDKLGHSPGADEFTNTMDLLGPQSTPFGEHGVDTSRTSSVAEGYADPDESAGWLALAEAEAMLEDSPVLSLIDPRLWNAEGGNELLSAQVNLQPAGMPEPPKRRPLKRSPRGTGLAQGPAQSRPRQGQTSSSMGITPRRRRGPKLSREEMLQKNREAARESRRRHAERTRKLQMRVEDLDSKHSDLEKERDALREFLNLLKHSLAGHAFCDHPPIDAWIRNEATWYAHRLHPPPPPSSHNETIVFVQQPNSTDSPPEITIPPPEEPTSDGGLDFIRQWLREDMIEGTT